MTTPGRLEEVSRKVMAFDLADVKQSYCRRYGLEPEAADVHERELKRYLVLCALNPETRYGMFSEIDNLWHEFICFTQKYHAFCKATAGRYIHHAPTGYDADRDSAGDSRRNTIRDYEAYFGPMDSKVWPGARAADCTPDQPCGSDPCTGDACSGGGCSSGISSDRSCIGRMGIATGGMPEAVDFVAGELQRERS